MTKFSNKNLGLIMLLIVIGFFIYAFNLNNPLFWDDIDWIVNNKFVHSLSFDNAINWFSHDILAGVGQSSNYYRPFLLFTFTLNHVLGGENPVGYHLLSNMLHIANAVLIFLLLFAVFKNKFISFWTSLIWLAHPLQTEAVTYVSGRGDPLNVFFMLLALYLWMTDIASRSSTYPHDRLAMSIMWISSVLLVLALLSRETAVIFPLLLMVFYVAFVGGGKLTTSGGQRTPDVKRWTFDVKEAFRKALPYFGIVFVYGILRLTVLNFENTLNFYSQSNPYTESFSTRMYTFLNVLWTYAGLMVLPLWQHMERSVTVFTYFWNWPTFSSFLVLLMVLAVLRYLYKKENTKHEARNTKQILNSKSQIQNVSNFDIRISDFRIWIFGVGWFFVNLIMTSGITPINAQLYEHWLYLALLGPLTLVIFYLHRIFHTNGKTVRAFIILFLTGLTAFFSVLSINRNILWGDPIKFFEDILKYEPDSARINNNLGTLYYNADNKEKAEEYYWKVANTKGNSFPQPYFNLGALLQERGDIRGAVVLFEKAIELDPNFAYPYPNLAVIYASQGDLVKATAYLEKLKELQPQLQRVYYNLALTYIKRGDYESAYANLQEGLKYGRFDPETEKLMKELIQRLTE